MAVRVRVALSLVVLCFTVSCRDPALIGAADDWAVSPTELHFGTVASSRPARRALGVTNRGAAPLHLHLEAQPPFSTAAQLDVGAGASGTADITLTAGPAGAAIGAVVISA